MQVGTPDLFKNHTKKKKKEKNKKKNKPKRLEPRRISSRDVWWNA